MEADEFGAGGDRKRVGEGGEREACGFEEGVVDSVGKIGPDGGFVNGVWWVGGGEMGGVVACPIPAVPCDSEGGDTAVDGDVIGRDIVRGLRSEGKEEEEED